MDGMGHKMEQRHKPHPDLFKPRTTSPSAVALLLLGISLIAVHIALAIMPPEAVGLIKNVLYAVNVRELAADIAYNSFTLGIAFLAAAGASQLASMLRVPPPSWKIKQELALALISLGLLPRDRGRWKGVYWVAPFGKYDFRAKRYTLLFNVKNVKATERKLEKIEGGTAGFAHSQYVAIEHARIEWMGNRRECMKLVIWYGTTPYGRNLDKGVPW